MGFICLLLWIIADTAAYIINLCYIVVVLDIGLNLAIQHKLLTDRTPLAKKFMELLKKTTTPVYDYVRNHEKLKKITKPIAGYDVVPYLIVAALIIAGIVMNNFSSYLAALAK